METELVALVTVAHTEMVIQGPTLSVQVAIESLIFWQNEHPSIMILLAYLSSKRTQYSCFVGFFTSCTVYKREQLKGVLTFLDLFSVHVRSHPSHSDPIIIVTKLCTKYLAGILFHYLKNAQNNHSELQLDPTMFLLILFVWQLFYVKYNSLCA